VNTHIIKFLLLLSLLFNITHASFIAMEDDCHHDDATSYVSEQSQSTECGDLCDMHHLFHFMAILTPSHLDFGSVLKEKNIQNIPTFHTSLFQEKHIKPPIA